jgi:sulfur transfer protein SufE
MLSDEQWKDIYTITVENRKDISWMREELERNHTEIDDCQSHINDIEIQHSFVRGKIAFLAISLTTVCTILVNACLWLYSHYGGAK